MPRIKPPPGGFAFFANLISGSCEICNRIIWWYYFGCSTFVSTKRNETMTRITEYDRSKFQGFKFSYQLNGSAGKFLSIQETPQQAIEEYFDFFGINPTECKQLSKWPSVK